MASLFPPASVYTADIHTGALSYELTRRLQGGPSHYPYFAGSFFPTCDVKVQRPRSERQVLPERPQDSAAEFLLLDIDRKLRDWEARSRRSRPPNSSDASMKGKIKKCASSPSICERELRTLSTKGGQHRFPRNPTLAEVPLIRSQTAFWVAEDAWNTQSSPDCGLMMTPLHFVTDPVGQNADDAAIDRRTVTNRSTSAKDRASQLSDALLVSPPIHRGDCSTCSATDDRTIHAASPTDLCPISTVVPQCPVPQKPYVNNRKRKADADAEMSTDRRKRRRIACNMSAIPLAPVFTSRERPGPQREHLFYAGASPLLQVKGCSIQYREELSELRSRDTADVVKSSHCGTDVPNEQAGPSLENKTWLKRRWKTLQRHGERMRYSLANLAARA